MPETVDVEAVGYTAGRNTRRGGCRGRSSLLTKCDRRQYRSHRRGDDAVTSRTAYLAAASLSRDPRCCWRSTSCWLSRRPLLTGIAIIICWAAARASDPRKNGVYLNLRCWLSRSSSLAQLADQPHRLESSAAILLQAWPTMPFAGGRCQFEPGDWFPHNHWPFLSARCPPPQFKSPVPD